MPCTRIYRPVLIPLLWYKALHNSLSRDNYKRMNFTPYQISDLVVRALSRACAIGLRSGKQLDISRPLFIDLARSKDTYPGAFILRTLNVPLTQLQYTLFEGPTMTGYYKQIQSIIDQSHYAMPSAELVR